MGCDLLVETQKLRERIRIERKARNKMSSDGQWEPLAEIKFSYSIDSTDPLPTVTELHCLCSRVFLKSYSDNYSHLLDQDEFNEFDDLIDPSTDIRTRTKSTVKSPLSHEELDDTYSNYFSASASHTDNYCSTDEHDPFLPIVQRQSSDSGAEHSEMHSDRSHRHHTTTHRYRNNSLPDVFGNRTLNKSWENFWTKNGEYIIWSTWIEKYSDYINPEYDPKSNVDVEQLDRCDKPKMEIIVSSCSPSSNPCDELDGWSVLSTKNHAKPEHGDHLLSPRCESVTSSIPLTIGTSDSMTNVTRITLSSYGFESDTDTDSNDSDDDDGQSIGFGTNKTHSERSAGESSDDDDLKTSLLRDDEDKTINLKSDQYWQVLWHIHFQEQYAIHYNNFQESERLFGSAELSSSLQSSTVYDSEHYTNVIKRKESEKKRKVNKKKRERVEDDGNLSKLISDLHFDETSRPMDGGNGNQPTDPSTDPVLFETEQMEAMGLPTSFSSTGFRSTGRSDGDGGRPPHQQSIILKRSHEIDDGEPPKPNDTIQATFSLMGFMYDDTNGIPTGSTIKADKIINRKKHIRLHNRILKIRQTNDKHIYFDDDGNEQRKKIKSDIGQLLHTSSDDDSAFNDEPVRAIAKSDDKWAVNVNRRDRKRRRRNIVANLPAEIANDRALLKYWYKRFSLFSLFDFGIKLDRESWFSVTPEKVAINIAKRCQCDILIDAFCGAGGNAIQFAKCCEKVIAIDIDPNKINLAKHNAGIYGVQDRIEFIVGDFLQLADHLKGDVIFLSPPWGGIEYMKDDVYDIEKSLIPIPASKLLGICRKITKDIGMFLPRNSNTHQLALLGGPGSSVEIEQNFLDNRLIALSIFYGNLVSKK